MKPFLTILIILCANIIFAQKVITGKVTDNESKPISGVTIYVVDADVKTQTDTAGKYAITVPEGFVVLKIEKINYYTEVVTITGNEMNITLRSSLFSYTDLSFEDLLTLRVTSVTHTSKQINEAPASVTVITKEMIRNRGYEILEDALKDMPGIDMQRLNGWYGSFFAQRGFIGDENKRTILMVNGVVDNMQWGSEVFTGYNLPLHNVERIEVVFGPASALYGANAFNGIINVITETKDAKEYTHTSIGGGSNKTAVSSFDISRNITNDLNIKIAANLFNTDGPKFESNYDHNYSNAYVDKAYAIDAQLHYKNTSFLMRHYVTPTGTGNCQGSPYKYVFTQMGDTTIPVILRTAGKGNTMLSEIYGEHGARFPIAGTTATLKHEYNPTKDLKLSALFYYRTSSLTPDHYDYSYNIRTRTNASDPLKKDTSYFDKNNTWVYSKGSGVDLRAVFSKSYLTSVLGVAMDYTDVPIDYTKASYTTYNGILEATTPAIDARRILYQNLAAYTQFLVPIRNMVQFTVGSRYDINSQYGNSFTPRIGVVGLLPYNFTAKLLFGEAFRAPTAREMYSTSTGFGTRISNPDLKPEKMRSVEAAIIYTLKKIGRIELNGYMNHAKDVIFSNVPFGKYLQNQNMGTMEIKGLDVRVTINPYSRLFVFGTCSFQDGTQTVLTSSKMTTVYDPIIGVDTAAYTLKIPNIAKVKWNLGFDYKIFKSLNVSFMVNAVGARSTIYTNPLRSVDGYLLANMNITYDFSKFAYISLKVINMFDRNNYDPGVRNANETSVLSQIEQPGRAFYVKLGFNL